MGAWIRRRWLAISVSVVVAVGFAWLMRAGALPIVPSRAALARVDPWVLVAHATLVLAALYLRSHRFVWLLAAIRPDKPVPLGRVLAVSFVGYGALVLLPFRTGEAVRPALLREKGGLSAWAVGGSVIAERIIDALVLSAILLGALTLAPHQPVLPDRIGELPVPVALVPRAAYGALVVFAAAFAGLALFYWRRAFAARLVAATVGRVWPQLAARIQEVLSRITDGLSFLPSGGVAVRFVAATLGYYALMATAIAVLMDGAGLPASSLARAAVVMGVLHLGVLLPNAPGYFGVFQVSVYAGLALYYSPGDVADAGSAVVFWMYVLQIGLALVAAAVALLAIGLSPAAALAAADQRP